MDLFVVAFRHEPLPEALAENWELAMLPVANAPVLRHIIETAARAEVTRVFVVAEHRPQSLRDFLENGRPWGIEASVLTPVAGRKWKGVFENLGDISHPFLFLPVLCLPSPEQLKSLAAACRESAPIVHLPGEINSVPMALWDTSFLQATEDLGLGVPDDLQGTVMADGLSPWPIKDLSSLHAVNMAALEGALSHLLRREKEHAPGVFIGHHCRISPTAKLSPPVMVGEFSHIGDHAVVGPHAVVGERCLVEKEAEIQRTVLTPETYAGLMTSHHDVFMAGRVRIDVTKNTCILVPDSFLQGEAAPTTRVGTPLRDAAHRILGAGFAVAILPLLFLIWALGGMRFPGREVAGPDVAATLDCTTTPSIVTIREGRIGGPLLRRLPALLDVLAGRLALVGPEPLSPPEAGALSEPWERLRFKVKPGFIPPWAGLASPPLDESEKRVINSHYARTASLGVDLSILLGCLRRGWAHLPRQD